MQMNQPINPTTNATTEEKPARAVRRKGTGIIAAALFMLIANPLIMVFAGKNIGLVIAYIAVIYLCWTDHRIHWAWRVLAAFVLIGCCYSQGQYIIHK